MLLLCFGSIGSHFGRRGFAWVFLPASVFSPCRHRARGARKNVLLRGSAAVPPALRVINPVVDLGGSRGRACRVQGGPLLTECLRRRVFPSDVSPVPVRLPLLRRGFGAPDHVLPGTAPKLRGLVGGLAARTLALRAGSVMVWAIQLLPLVTGAGAKNCCDAFLRRQGPSPPRPPAHAAAAGPLLPVLYGRSTVRSAMRPVDAHGHRAQQPPVSLRRQPPSGMKRSPRAARISVSMTLVKWRRQLCRMRWWFLQSGFVACFQMAAFGGVIKHP